MERAVLSALLAVLQIVPFVSSALSFQCGFFVCLFVFCYMMYYIQLGIRLCITDPIKWLLSVGNVHSRICPFAVIQVRTQCSWCSVQSACFSLARWTVQYKWLCLKMDTGNDCCKDMHKQVAVFVSIQPTKMIRLLKEACLVIGQCIRHSGTVFSQCFINRSLDKVDLLFTTTV